MTGNPIRTIYLDANIFIYATEGAASPLKQQLTRIFERIASRGLSAVTRELSLAEVLVKPLHDGRMDLVSTYERVLQSTSNFEVVPVSREVIRAAAGIRAVRGWRLPDSIHIATAQLTGCEVFLTNDRRLPSIERLTVATPETFTF